MARRIYAGVFMAQRELDAQTRARLLKHLDVGSPIAEYDQLLADARIDTPVFEDLVRDKVDIVKGTKGSGKTALFRIFMDLLPDHMLKRGVLLVAGIENVRDPIFLKYRSALEGLDEIAFENFWRMYLISVINNNIFFNEQFTDSPLQAAKKELAAYRECCAAHGYPTPKGLTPQTIITWALSKVPKPRLKKIKIGIGADATSGAPQGTLEIEREPDEESPGPSVPR